MVKALAGLDDLRSRRFHDRLFEATQRMFADAGDEDHAQWSAIIAMSGIACDSAAGYALGCYLELDAQRATPHLSAGQTRKVRDLLRSKKIVNLKPKTQRTHWEALSGDRLPRWPDWIRYVRCVDRRNAVLHEGVLPSRRLPVRADGVEAIEVTQSLHAHLAEVMRREPLLRHLA